MKPPSGRWGLTPGEKRALLLIAAALLIGSGYRLVQQRESPVGPALTADDSAAVQRIRQAYSDRLKDPVRTQADPTSRAIADDMVVNGLLDLNRADQAALEKLPGIGPVLASRILDLRRRKGTFRNVTELLEVRGIGEKKLQAISSRVFCGGADFKTAADPAADQKSK